MFRFEKLKVWDESRALVKQIYTLTKQFPADEKFCLTDQIRRATISISLNIAEGSDRKSDNEFKRFLRMAISSLDEVVTGLYIALDLKYVSKDEFENVYKELNILAAKINALINSLKAVDNKQ
jgi:four helix bundle protein